MKINKLFIALLVVALLIMALPVACGDAETATTPLTTPSTTTATPTVTTTPTTTTTSATTTPPSFTTDLVTFSISDFEGSGSCAVCHSKLTDSAGNDVSISSHWRSTMMANAAKDPYYQAMVRSEIIHHPELKDVIEDTCATCHMPMARTQALVDDLPSLMFDSGFLNPANELNEAAMDGVSCSLCHQIQSVNLGEADSFGGNFIIDTSTEPPDRVEFGPYPRPLTSPMREQVGFTPTFGLHVDNSNLCATCHTVFTPYLDSEGNILGTFPEQTPYLEWKHSNFSTNVMCQTCHMLTATGPASLTNLPSMYVERSPFYQHYFVGGNFFMTQLLKENIEGLALTSPASQFEATLARVQEQLQNRSARLSLDRTEINGDTLEIVVNIGNIAGHKFPTGYPSRRAWIYLTVTDTNGQVVFQSGKPNDNGSITGNNADEDALSYEPHYDIISQPDQVQIYESIMQNSDGQITYALLRGAGYAKDNRILPQGFDKDTASQDVAVYGEAAEDNNFVGGSDKVNYQINIQGYSGPFTVSAELLYHPISYQFTKDLLDSDDTVIEVFNDLYQDADKTPIQIASIIQTTTTITTTPPPTTTTEPTEAPMILHDVSGREGLCLICHGEQSAEQLRFPDDHIGRTADECLICHEAAGDRVTITWGELAESGQRAFLSNCASCHGDDGQGGGEAPANIGPNLRGFITAQRLFNFISSQMPWDGPGSLSKLRYQQILAFMLTESNLIQPEAVFDEGNLANIILNE